MGVSARHLSCSRVGSGMATLIAPPPCWRRTPQGVQGPILTATFSSALQGTDAPSSQLYSVDGMPQRSAPVTPSRFVASTPAGDYGLIFRALFNNSDGAAARFLGCSRMSAWRWRHGRVPISRALAETLLAQVRDKLADVLAAEQAMRLYLDRPLQPRRLTGCCAPNALPCVVREGRGRGVRPHNSL